MKFSYSLKVNNSRIKFSTFFYDLPFLTTPPILYRMCVQAVYIIPNIHNFRSGAIVLKNIKLNNLYFWFITEL